VDINDKTIHRPIRDILDDLSAACLEREHADAVLANLLKKLNLSGVL
jgi:hypothetical protein